MAKSFSVSFNINGSLDGSLAAALQAAAQQFKALGNAAQSLNGKSIKLSQALQNAQGLLKNIEAYKSLQKAIAQTAAAQIQARADSAKLLRQRNAEQKQLDAMRDAYDRLKKYYRDNKKSMGAEAAAAVKSQLKSARDELTAQQRFVQNLGTSYGQSGKRIESLNNQLAQQRAQLSQMRTTVPASNLAASESALRAQITQTTAALNQEIAALQRRNEIQTRFNQSQQTMSNAYSNFQNSLQTAETIMNPFKDAAQNAMTFEYAMSRVKSLSQMRDIRAGNFDKVNASMAQLTNQARELGAATEFTATEIAQAQGYFAMAGWSSDRIMAVLPSTVDLASISGDHNLARTADVISDDMSAFGIKAGQAYQLAGGKVVEGASFFTDAFAFAITQANLDREALHEAWKYNAAGAKTAGMSLGETFAMNMVVANSGIKGSQAGTTFRAGWTRFLAPPKTALKSLEEMGMTASDATKSLMEAQAALNEAGASMDDDLFTKITKAQQYYQTLDKNARAGWLKNLVGQNALTGWQIAFDSGNFQDIIKFAKEIDSGSIQGWAKDTAAVMRDNTQTSIELLKSSMDAFQRSMGDALTPAIRSAAEAFAPLLTAAGQWVVQNPQIVQTVAAIAAALAAATVAVAGFSLAMAGVRFVQAGWATAGLLFGDIAAKAALAATSIRGFFTSLSIGSMASSIAATISSIGTAIMGAARAAMLFALSPVGIALVALAIAGLYVYQNWDKVSSVFSTLASTLSGIMSPAIQSATQAVQTLFQTLGQSFDSSAFQSLSSLVSSLTSAVGGGLVGAFLVLAGVVGSVLAGIVTGIAGLVKTVAELGTGLTTAFYQLSEGNFSDAFSTLADTGKQAAENFKNAWTDSFGAVKDGILATNDAVNQFMQPQDTVAATLAQVQTTYPTAQSPVPETSQPIDTSQAQAALDNVAPAAQNASTGLETFSQIPQQFANVAPSVDTFSTGLTTAGTNVQTFGTEATNAGTGVDALSASAQNATGGIDALSASASGATGGIEALSSASAGAAGSVAGLGAAAQSAIAQMAAAGAGAAAAVNAAVASIPTATPAANYAGGIYKRGAFLTTFAEKSPEAAIPIDNSQRARDLWLRAGQMLGTLSGTANYDSAPKDSLGNLKNVDVPEYNRIGEGDTLTVKRLKMQAQREQFNRQSNQNQSIQRQINSIRQQYARERLNNRQPAQVSAQNQSIQRQINSIRQQYARETLQRRLSPAEHNARLREQVLSGRLSIDDAVNQVKMPSGATIGDALKYLPAQKSILPSNVDKTGGFWDSVPSNFDIPNPSNIFGEVLNKLPNPSNIFGEVLNKLPNPSNIFGDIFGRLTEHLQLPTTGIFDGLLGGLTSPQANSGGNSFQVTINVTANGSDENSIRNAVESAVPSLESWADKFFEHQHELARRSFA